MFLRVYIVYCLLYCNSIVAVTLEVPEDSHADLAGAAQSSTKRRSGTRCPTSGHQPERDRDAELAASSGLPNQCSIDEKGYVYSREDSGASSYLGGLPDFTRVIHIIYFSSSLFCSFVQSLNHIIT